MALFGLVREKCTFCRIQIEKGQEFNAQVKVPGYVGTFSKKFCGEEHATAYKKELENRPINATGSGGCCG